MGKLRNEVAYAVACSCGVCQEETGRDFMILGFLHSSPAQARRDVARYRKTTIHQSLIIVKEMIEPFDLHPEARRDQKPKRRKAA